MRIFQFRFNLQDYFFDIFLLLFFFQVIRVSLFEFLLHYSKLTSFFVYLMVNAAMAYHYALFWYNIKGFLPEKITNKNSFIFVCFLFIMIWSFFVTIRFFDYFQFGYLWVLSMILGILTFVGVLIAALNEADFAKGIKHLYLISYGVFSGIVLFIGVPYRVGSYIYQMSEMKWFGWLTGFILFLVLLVLLWLAIYFIEKFKSTLSFWLLTKKKKIKSKLIISIEKASSRIFNIVLLNLPVIILGFYFEMVQKFYENNLLMLFVEGILPARIAHLIRKPLRVGNIISLLVFLFLLIFYA